MSATAEKVKPAAKRSRLEIVDDALAKDEAELGAARARFVELAAAEDDAVRESKRANPTASPYTLRSPAQLIRDEREKLERTISGLEKGLLALQAERAAASSEQAAQELSERTKQAKEQGARERELRREAAAAFAGLVERWNALAECLSERSALAGEVAQAELLKRVGLFDRPAAAAWEEASRLTVEPVPTSFAAFLEEAIEATTGARPNEGDEGLAELNRHRATLGLVAEQHHVSPSARELASAWPDLRGEISSATVSGVPVRRSAGTGIGWPDEAA
jgi:hypothetical protein